LERTLGRKRWRSKSLKNVVGSELWCGSFPGARDGHAGLHGDAGGGDIGHQPIELVLPEATARQPGRPSYDEQIVMACGEKLAYGYRRVAWWLQRKKGLPVNRKRVLRVMRERGLLVRSRRLRARRKKEWGRVEASGRINLADGHDENMGRSAVGWAYLVCVIDCCTREIVGWNLSHRCRTEDALAAVEQAVLERLPLGSREETERFRCRRQRPVLLSRLPKGSRSSTACSTAASASSVRQRCERFHPTISRVQQVDHAHQVRPAHGRTGPYFRHVRLQI